MRLLPVLALLAAAPAAARHRQPAPPLHPRNATALRQRPHLPSAAAAASTFSTPSTLWPLPANVSAPPNSTPCTFSAPLNNTYLPGCASGSYPCASFPTLALAQAACSLDYACGGVCSQPGGAAPWETRHATTPQASSSGEVSSNITNSCHGSGPPPGSGACLALPPSLAIAASAGSFSNGVLTAAMARYAALINAQYAPSGAAPAGVPVLGAVEVTVQGAPALAFGVDESYVLDIPAAAGGLVTLVAPTVWGALRGLETLSQLAHHTWTLSAAGAVNASFSALCSTHIEDAPRFPMRSLMVDTSRHFLPVSVLKQVMDLLAYLKMNSLRLHLIDSQSWSYFVPELPIITNTSAFSPLHVYYPEDLRELVAFGAARGIIVWPEVDFPSHSQILLDSIPEMGCLSPAPNAYRMFIDPSYAQLWPTMDKIFGVLNDVFPPEYPFHWALCPSVVAWGAARGVAPADLPRAITDWWYTAMYNWLAAPPYQRTVFAWEDASDAVNASTWPGASSGGLVIEQWDGSPGEWRDGVCSIASMTNASILVAGPFHDVIGAPPSFNSNPEQNYADVLDVSCSVTPRLVEEVEGGGGVELMFWDDAADISASDVVLMLMSSLLPVAESGWSQQATVAPGAVSAERYKDMRCRLARRGMQSHDAYGQVGTFCVMEYEAALMPWSGP